MERDRVVDFRADLPRRQMFAKQVANRGGNPDDELVVDVVIPFPLSGQADRAGEAVVFEELLVACCGFAALVRPRFEVAQLDAKHGGLQGIEPRVEADFVMVVLGLHSVDAQPRQRTAELGVVRDHHSAVAEASQVLGRIKAERPDMAEASRRMFVVAGTDRLGRVFQDEEVVFLGDLR